MPVYKYTKNGTTSSETINGSSYNDQIFGDKGNDILYGNAGDDYLDGGLGVDTLSGGTGNDILVFDAADFTGTSLAYTGGTGTDTLLFKTAATVDFTKLDDSARLSLEVIDLESDGGASSLTFKAADVRAMTSDTTTSSPKPLVVNGDTSDKLFLDGFIKTGSVVQNGHTYAVYSSGYAVSSQKVWADIDIQVNPPQAKDDTASATEASGTLNGTPGVDPTGNVLTNDVDLSGDTLTVTEVRTKGEAEVGGTPGTVGVALPGTYGTLTLLADGSYAYAVNNSNTDVQKLNVGDKLQESFTYTVSDSVYTDTAQLTVTINGANDAPVATDNGAWVMESGGVGNSIGGVPVVQGNFLSDDTDVDNLTSSLVVSQVNGSAANVGVAIVGKYGSLLVAADGSYKYTLDNNDPDTEALKTGDFGFDNFTYQVKDPGGAVDTADISIGIVGQDDNPVAADDFWIMSGNTANTSAHIPLDFLLDNDSNGAQPYTVTNVGDVTGAVTKAEIAPDGVTVTTGGTPNFGSAVGTFDYILKDAAGLTDTGTVNVKVIDETPLLNTYDLRDELYTFSYIASPLGGNSIFLGGKGVDWYVGGTGKDFITGGAGDDKIDISDGNGSTVDTIYFGSINDGKDSILGFKTGTDKIDLDDLFDSLGYSVPDRGQSSGFLIQSAGGNVYNLLIDADSTPNPSNDPAAYEYFAATITTTGGTLTSGDFILT